MKKTYFLFFVLVISCHTKTNFCIVTANEVLNKYPDKVFVSKKKNGIIKEISDSGLGKIVRGIYYFSDEGTLESYKFFGDTLAYSYNNEYDKNGKLIKNEGGTLVKQFIREINPDSISVKTLLFSLNNSFQDIKVLINDTAQLELQAKDDHFFSNIKTVTFGLNIQNKVRAKFLFLIRYSDACMGKDTLVRDSINFVRPQ